MGRRGRMLMLVVCGVLAGPAAALATEQEQLDQAARLAVTRAVALLGQRPKIDGVNNVAVCPIWADQQRYVTEQAKAAVTIETPYRLFTRQDAEWDKLLAEIEWSERREDLMNPETVKRFGRIEGVDAILYGTVREWSLSVWSTRALCRLNLHLANVETGEIVWSSGEVQAEAYPPWPDLVKRFWKYPLLVIGGVVVLIVVLAIIYKVKRAFRRAMRPR